MSNTNTQSSHEDGNNYVDMHTIGLGYLSRVREVTVRKGKPFMSAFISGFHGEKGQQEGGMTYVPFDVRASSEQAQEVLKTFVEQANDRSKRVLVRFKIGDQYIDSYQVNNGPRAGTTGFTMKGRLLFVSHVWVKTNETDGYELAYQAETKQAAQPARDGTNG